MNPQQQLYALTSLRGIAAWWVVIYHFREQLPPQVPRLVEAVASYGYLAVDLFFILSGFVLALTYGKRFRSGLGYYANFIGLRLARIYPLHLLVMILYLSVPAALILFSKQDVKVSDFDFTYYVQSLLLIQNWGINDRLAWNVPAWSISTEMFAYLFFPVMAFLVLRFIRSLAGAIALCCGILAVLAWLASLRVPSLGADIEHFGLIRCCIEVTAGVALHQLMVIRPAQGSLDSWLGIAVFVCCTVLMTLGIAPDYLVMPLGFLALIYGLANNEAGPASLLRSSWLQTLGALSYSTYLIHFLVKEWVKLLLVRADAPPSVLALAAYLLVTLAASYILFHYLEMPAQRALRSRVSGFLLGRSHAMRLPWQAQREKP